QPAAGHDGVDSPSRGLDFGQFGHGPGANMIDWSVLDFAINQADRVKSSYMQMKSVWVACFLALACTQGQAAQMQPRPGHADEGVVHVPAPETEIIRLRPGQLPEVTLSADILYRILASEVAAQRGVYGTAANTMLELARDTSDPRL